MKFDLQLPVPVQSADGLECSFHYRSRRCRFVSAPERFRLWIESRELEPTRVLNAEEQAEWAQLQEPHYRFGLLPPNEPPRRLLCLHVELILRRYFDVLDGVAPPGWNDN